MRATRHASTNAEITLIQRYNSFASHVDFHREVIRLNPARFEIGAIYNARPKDKRLQLKQALKPVQRELVFDIDMTDYDEIRTCCQGKGICTRCWKFIACAVKVLDRALRGESKRRRRESLAESRLFADAQMISAFST